MAERAMERFLYRQAAGITVLSARMAEFSYRRHAHEAYAFGVTLRGLQRFHLGDETHASQRGGVIRFRPEAPHDGWAGSREGIDYLMIYVPAPLLAEVLELRDPLRFPATVERDPRAAAALVRLGRCVLDGRDEALASELFLHAACTVAGRVLPEAGGRDPLRMRRAREMIREDMGKGLRLDGLCRELGVSKYHFIRLFHAAEGLTPYQYFLNCRIERARSLLERGEDVYAVMLECGFYDLSHLNRYFKAMYGATPLEFQRQVRGG